MRTVYTTIKISQPQYDVELFRFYRTGVGRQLYLKQSSITQNDSTATVRYHYDGACRIDSLRLGKDVVKAMSYNANGWLTRSSVSGPMLIKFPPVDPDLPVLPRPGQAKAVAHKGNIFNETLHYADAAAVGAPRYDGKISVRNCDNALTAYAYDCHGRLITSTSYSYRGSATSADFSTEYAYDRNANLLNVTRNGIIDNVRGIRTYGINNDISMTYSANRLKSVTVTAEGADYEGRTGLPQFQSSGVDFTYDPNGNMISDAVRGITDIRYNRLNLPVRLTFADGHRQTIAYDGFGRKTKIDYAQGPETIFGGDLPAEQDYVITSSRVYAGPHIFADGQLEYSAFDGGYFNADGSPCYYITDWQGNNAAVVNSAGSIIQSAAYYPYGEPTVEPKGQRFLFGGKEREHAGGRNAYDFGARSLTPYGSWPSPDPKAEDFYQISPFSYCAGDPINFIDPTGKDATIIVNGDELTVSATVYIFGVNANEELARIYKRDLLNIWGKITEYTYGGTTYSVNWDIDVRVLEGGKIIFNGVNNYMKVINERSWVSRTNYGHIRYSGSYGQSIAEDCPMSHEFGHMLGLKDRYDEETYMPESPEWNNDIMAEYPDHPARIVNIDHLEKLFTPAIRLNEIVNILRMLPITNRFVLSKTIFYINRFTRAEPPVGTKEY